MSSEENSKSSPQVPFVLTNREAQELYAEGFAQMLIGFPTSKLLLHTVISTPNPDDQKETRRGVAWIVMPTAALVEMAHLIVSSIKQAEPQMDAMAQSQIERLHDLLRGVPAESPPKQ